MARIERDAKIQPKAYLRPCYARQQAPIAPTIWTGDTAFAVGVACPICGKMGRISTS